jgi:alpha-tubulin suppressor-like RCC1 family protein
MAFTFSGLNFVGDVSAQAVFTPPPSYYLWSWGRNNNGQLGLGNTTYYSSPKQIGSLTTWSKISVVGNFAVSLKTDGTMWSWGLNEQGRLGVGDTANRSSPIQIGALTTWLSVAAGYNHSVTLKTDSTLWSWGGNNFGQLGLGNTTDRSSPVQIGALTTWSSVDTAGFGALAISN